MKKRKKVAVALIAAAIAATTLPTCLSDGGAQRQQQPRMGMGGDKILMQMDEYANDLRARGASEEDVEKMMEQRFPREDVEKWKQIRGR